MRRYSRAIVWLGALLVAALIVAGCSDGDAPAASSVEPTEISATATEVPPEATVPAPTEEATPTAVVPAPTEEAAPAEEPAPTGEPVPTAVQPEPEASIFQDCGQVYLCAELEVPVDHNDPDAGTTTLELGMLPAGDPDRRIGALLVNPGGPGGEMHGFLENGAGLSDQLLARFDVVGWNPRGVSASLNPNCRDEADNLQLVGALSDTPENEVAIADAAQQAAEACLAGLNGRAEVISTVQTVHDMDSIRQALGEDQISFFGYSYGTVLGQFYADLYGANARAVVIDGVLDASLTHEDVLVEQMRGFARVIDAIFDACLADAACPIVGSPKSAYLQLMDSLETNPVLDAEGNVLVGPGEAQLALVMVSYFPEEQWPLLFRAFAQVWGEDDGQLMHDLAHFYLGAVDLGSFFSISCTDGGRMSESDLDRFVGRMVEEAGDFGRAAAAEARMCVYWPDIEPRPHEPIRAPNADSVLVIGNRGDNATPYEWAVAVAEALETGILLTFNGTGHTSYGLHPCVDEVVDSYLIDLVLPSEDIECG
ncbi:MAG: alpha/beta fold hydrolase [bacterium]|nr:alpha/beta fold hydrolase [bacterium]